MNAQTLMLITLGCLLLSGLFISMVGQRTPFPRVTLLIIFGVFIGPEGANMIPTLFVEQFDLIAQVALIMVGFLIGGKLTRRDLAASSFPIIAVSIGASVLTAIIVMSGLLLLGTSPILAVMLGCIAAATDATAIYDVATQNNKSNKFKKLLLSVVALDDAWAMLLFGVGVAVVYSFYGASDSSALLHAIKDIGGGVLLGIALGLPSAIFTGRIQEGKPMLSEALGIVFLCGGLAMWLNVSYLISAMTLGAVITNMAKHHDYPFHAIEGIEEQFMMIFFILAGATLNFNTVLSLGVIGIFYLLLRIIGKIVGAYIGASISHLDAASTRWLGPALLPQAGVAIGMSLVAAQKFPEYGDTLLAIVIASTVFFEVIGPILTHISIQKVSALNTKSPE